MSYKRWTIWRANLDPLIGSEQGLTRPVLVISEDAINELINTINVIPITSRKGNRMIYPNEVLLEEKFLWITRRINCFVPSNKDFR